MHQELQMQEQPEEQSHVQTITACIQEQLIFLKFHACLDNTTRNKNTTNLTASIRSKLISDDLTAWRRSVILNSDDLCA